MTPPRSLTVVVLPRGRPRMLEATLRSAREQTGVRVEVVVAGPGRPAAARNAAMRGASTPWLGFLEEGDLWAPDRARRQLEQAEDEDASFAYCGRVVVGTNGAPLDLALPADPASLGRRLRRANALGSGSAVLVRTDLLESVGGFEEDLEVFEAWALWMALAAHGRGCADAEFLVAETVDDRRPEIVRPRRAIAELRRLREQGRLDTQDRDELMHLAADLRAHGRHREAAAAYAECGLTHRRPQDLVRAAGALRDGPPAALQPWWLAPRWLEEAVA